MLNYAQHVSNRRTPQTEQADPKQKENSAGGFSFVLDHWGRLDRFLILGTEGGTYYATERKATKRSFTALDACLAEDGPKTVARIVEISDGGRAPKNDPAIVALAYASACQTGKDGGATTRKAALDALPKVCRIGTHLFSFVASVKEFRGFGRGLKRALGRWYLARDADALAYQAVKYQQRNGWSHRDVLRLSHPTADTPDQDSVLRWVLGGMDAMGAREVTRLEGKDCKYDAIDTSNLPVLIQGFEAIKQERDIKTVVSLIEKHRLTHEMVPNEVKSDPKVWGALLKTMPLGAMIRNLGKMTSIGLLKSMSVESKFVIAALSDSAKIKKARIHPLAALVALNTYKAGKGVKGSLTWNPVSGIVDALDDLFYASFDTVEPTGKNILLALDVSGSMSWGEIAGLPGITPRVGSAAMAMITARTEQNYEFMAFSHQLVPIKITAKMSLDQVLKAVDNVPMGGTDCSLPMQWANQNKVAVDAFYIYTDSETWSGGNHPHQALVDYRRKHTRDARLIVVGMTASDFSIANPSDPGMMDVVGFDTSAPKIMADFTRGTF